MSKKPPFRKKLSALPDLPPPGAQVNIRAYPLVQFRVGDVDPGDTVLMLFTYATEVGPPPEFEQTLPMMANLQTARALRDAFDEAVRQIESRLSKQSSEQPKH